MRVISRMNIGGPSIHVKDLTENLNPDKFTTRLITGTVSPGEGDMGYIANFKGNVRIHIPELQRELSFYRDLKALLKVIKTMHQFDPDIVHSHMSKAGTVSRLAAMVCNLFNAKKILTVHTFHGNVLDGYFSKLKSYIFLMIERLMAKLTDQIIAISDSQKWELTHVYKIESLQKVVTIKLGFDLTPFKRSRIHKGCLKRRLALPEDCLLIGIIGRLAPIKNHKMFLDSAKLLIDKKVGKKIKFILIGDGEDRHFLEAYATAIGIEKYVYFYGWEKNIPIVYADLNILALTSLNEGTPVSVIEAMAASVPVVTTGVGGIKDLLGRVLKKNVDNRGFQICERGILCPRGDPEIFSSAMAFMINSGILSDQTRIKSARDYVLNNYSVERLIHDVESLYYNLVG